MTELMERWGRTITAGEQYRSLADAAKETGNDKYGKGRTAVYYMKPWIFSHLIHGWEFAAKRHPESLPDPKDLKKTHVFVGFVSETRPDAVWQMMQGEMWSPQGEANSMISRLGLQHTSMSVGDIVKTPAGVYMVEGAGFKKFG